MKPSKKKEIVARKKWMFVKQEDPKAKVSDYGLIIPDSAEEEQKAQGEVLSVGSEITDVKKGDRVIFGAYAGEKMEVVEDGKKVNYLLLHDDDVIAFIK